MNDQTTPLDVMLSKPSLMSTSRVYTNIDGQKLRWKDGNKLYCISEDTGLNLATYYENPFCLLSGKKSTLDISSSGAPFADVLVVTWVVMEKKVRERRAGGGG
ncbi:hypothetical protein FRC07_012240, partial [Ceratobasidium sp. 392]